MMTHSLVIDSLRQPGYAWCVDCRLTRSPSDACPEGAGDQATPRERQAGDNEDDATGTRPGGERLAGPSAQFTGVCKARPLAHLLTEAVLGVRCPTHDFAGRSIQRQLRSRKRVP